MSKCFDSDLPLGKLDRVPFTFKHHLLDHPALTMEGLAESLPQLHPDRITYSKGLSDLSINFDRSHLEHGNGLSLRETIETIRTSSSYIAVRDPVDHPVFRDLYESLRAEMTELQRQSGNSQAIHEPRMWLFIASPNAMTPFHFDRYSNVLMQIRGSKEVAVFPNFRPDIVPIDICEAYMDRKDVQAPWHPDLDAHAIKFDFRPGDTLHIPYTAGHYVKNGPEDVSISLSFFFQTDETLRWTRAMQFNHRVRKRIERFGMSPSPVGQNRYVDSAKAKALPLLSMMWKLAS